MNTSAVKPSLSKSILSGLLAGLAVAFLSLIYTMVYRETTGFATAKIIMPISIFIGFPILLVLGGFAYFLFQKHLHAGNVWFIIFCIAFLVTLALITVQDTRNEGGRFISGLRGLCLGLELITCLLAVFLIPYFARHPQIYE